MRFDGAVMGLLMSSPAFVSHEQGISYEPVMQFRFVPANAFSRFCCARNFDGFRLVTAHKKLIITASIFCHKFLQPTSLHPTEHLQAMDE